MKLGFLQCMFLIFMTMKLTGHIDWSWWTVTAPIWIDCVFAAILAAWLATASDKVQRAVSAALKS